MAMKMMSMAAPFVVVVLASTVLQSTYATNYTVGDATGWDIPTGNGAREFYDNWADNKNFVVGDILVFNFNSSIHNVAEVNEAAYDSCNTANPISTWTTSPARIPLNRTGDYHFICTFPNHCGFGQKLSIDARTGPSTPPTPGGTPTTPSSASSLVATISLVLMSAASVLFC